METKQPKIAGYMHYYIKDNELKIKFIPKELKEAFLKKFGDNLLYADEDEVEKFLKKK